MRTYWVVVQYFVSMAKGDVIHGQHVNLVIFCSQFLLYSLSTQITTPGISEGTALSSPNDFMDLLSMNFSDSCFEDPLRVCICNLLWQQALEIHYRVGKMIGCFFALTQFPTIFTEQPLLHIMWNLVNSSSALSLCRNFSDLPPSPPSSPKRREI